MPKNKQGGKGYKKGKKGGQENEGKRELIFKGEDPDLGDTEYAQVIKVLGSGIMDVQCFDGQRRQATIRGSMMKKIWIKLGDVILVGLRDFQDSKCDVMHKYTPDEVKTLIALGEIPDNIHGNDDSDIEFADDSDEEDNQQKKTNIKVQLNSDKDDDDEEEEKKDNSIDVDDI